MVTPKQLLDHLIEDTRLAVDLIFLVPTLYEVRDNQLLLRFSEYDGFETGPTRYGDQTTVTWNLDVPYVEVKYFEI